MVYAGLLSDDLQCYTEKAGLTSNEVFLSMKIVRAVYGLEQLPAESTVSKTEDSRL